MERVILTTGGTGGHIFPALAVAEEIRRRYPKALILFLGAAQGPEADIAVQAGLDFVGLPVKGVVGKGASGIFGALGMARGVLKASALMRRFRPQIVVGFGGYAAFAGVLAASFGGKITAVHEQNSIPGLTNKLLGKVVDKVFLSMPDASGAFAPAKTVLTGNPVRAGIAALHTEDRRNAKDHPPTEGRAPRLLVMGGSLGARAVNEAVADCLPMLREAGVDIWHQTGQSDYETVRKKYREANAEHVRVEAFINDMPRAYAWADLALCRAGASSVAELACAGVPAVLVPYPFAAGNHQLHNARFLEAEGGAVVLGQSHFGEGKRQVLLDSLLSLLIDGPRLRRMSECCKRAAKPDAAALLVNELESMLIKRFKAA